MVLLRKIITMSSSWLVMEIFPYVFIHLSFIHAVMNQIFQDSMKTKK